MYNTYLFYCYKIFNNDYFDVRVGFIPFWIVFYSFAKALCSFKDTFNSFIASWEPYLKEFFQTKSYLFYIYYFKITTFNFASFKSS